jgi:hypothetical protein
LISVGPAAATDATARVAIGGLNVAVGDVATAAAADEPVTTFGVGIETARPLAAVCAVCGDAAGVVPPARVLEARAVSSAVDTESALNPAAAGATVTAVESLPAPLEKPLELPLPNGSSAPTRRDETVDDLPSAAEAADPRPLEAEFVSASAQPAAASEPAPKPAETVIAHSQIEHRLTMTPPK